MKFWSVVEATFVALMQWGIFSSTCSNKLTPERPAIPAQHFWCFSQPLWVVRSLDHLMYVGLHSRVRHGYEIWMHKSRHIWLTFQIPAGFTPSLVDKCKVLLLFTCVVLIYLAERLEIWQACVGLDFSRMRLIQHNRSVNGQPAHSFATFQMATRLKFTNRYGWIRLEH